MKNNKLNALAKEANEMIDEIKNKSKCEACLTQVIKALSIIKDSHNIDVCSRFKSYREYQFHNKKLEEKIRRDLR